MDETWLPVVGYEGFYEVSNLGQVRTVTRVVPNGANTTRIVPEKILKTPADQHGYAHVLLSRENRQKSHKVHQLVAEAFIGPRPENSLKGVRMDGFNVLHADGNKNNNRASNLRYGSQTDNIADAKVHGTWSPPPVGLAWVSGKRKRRG